MAELFYYLAFEESDLDQQSNEKSGFGAVDGDYAEIMPDGERIRIHEPQLSDNFYKIIVVGDYGVGKSALLARFCDDFFREVHSATIGIDYRTRSLALPPENDRAEKSRSALNKKTKVKLEIFDTAGLQKYRAIASAYFHTATGVLIVYDVTEPDSFESVENYLRQLRPLMRPDAELLIVGNKADLVEERRVSYTEAEAQFSKLGISLIETSAKTGSNVEDLFMELAIRIREKFDTPALQQQQDLESIITENEEGRKKVVLDEAEMKPQVWCWCSV